MGVSVTVLNLFLGLFASHLIDLSRAVNMGDGSGQLDVFATVRSSITCIHEKDISTNKFCELDMQVRNI